MVFVDILLGIPTPKLSVPSEFKVRYTPSEILLQWIQWILNSWLNRTCSIILQPTRPDRGWIINPISEKNPWWIILASAIPAILASILVFLDQQITSVIVNRKENKLKVISFTFFLSYYIQLDLWMCESTNKTSLFSPL